jgi:hypothetical protein
LRRCQLALRYNCGESTPWSSIFRASPTCRGSIEFQEADPAGRELIQGIVADPFLIAPTEVIVLRLVG